MEYFLIPASLVLRTVHRNNQNQYEILLYLLVHSKRYSHSIPQLIILGIKIIPASDILYERRNLHISIVLLTLNRYYVIIL
jgi:hypothetical protein